MRFTSIGSMIQSIRTEKSTITRKKLAYGICSEQTLFGIETGQCEADILMLDILIQRLGKSPDKFEMVLNADMYNMVRLRDLLEKSILKGKRNLAERILRAYPSQTNVDQMYRHRMRASLLYHMDRDFAGASEHLQVAVSITLPGFTYDRMGDYLISAIELENLLALEMIGTDTMSAKTGPEIKSRLESCMNYIILHFKGDEEHSKLYSKCSWLLARIYYREGNYVQVCALCERGMECLRRNTQIYFMLPLLKLMTAAEEKLGIAAAQSKWVQYYQILTFLWEGYAPKWCPTDSIFHNCCQRMYHLDYELVRAERNARGISQEGLADGIYKNAASLSRLETGKVSSSKKTFEKLMGKLGFEKGRYNGYVVTDSFEVMEMRRNIDEYLMRRDYQKAKGLIAKLKNCLDMEITENRRVIKTYEIITTKCLGEITALEALEGLKKLSQGFFDYDKKVFSHIPMRSEVLLINNICINLREIGLEQESSELYKLTMQKIKSSKVNVKHRYHSYAILLNNYMRRDRSYSDSCEGIRYELLCGKATEIPFSLNNILHILEQKGISGEEGEKWAKAIYYMSDLFYFVKEKEIYGTFLKTKCHIEILD